MSFTRIELAQAYNCHPQTMRKRINELILGKELVLSSRGRLINDADAKIICEKLGFDFNKLEKK